MVVVFANNQTMVAMFSIGSTVITTDPVPLRGNDRASCILNTHSIFATGGTPRLTYQAQVSNDGGPNFVDAGGVTDLTTTTGLRRLVATLNGAALIRFRYTLDWQAGGAGSDIAACCFDLHVDLDHV